MMKKTALALCVAVMVVATAWAADTAAKKGAEVTMKGKLSCAYCKLGSAPEHKCTKECCQACVKGGDSALLQDEKGALYLLLAKDKEKPVMAGDRMALMGDMVMVKGMMVKGNGIQCIYVEDMKKAEEPKAAEKKPAEKK